MQKTYRTTSEHRTVLCKNHTVTCTKPFCTVKKQTVQYENFRLYVIVVQVLHNECFQLLIGISSLFQYYQMLADIHIINNVNLNIYGTFIDGNQIYVYSFNVLKKFFIASSKMQSATLKNNNVTVLERYISDGRKNVTVCVQGYRKKNRLVIILLC